MLLNKIIKIKKKEIKIRKEKLPLSRLKTYLRKSNRDFKKALSKGFNLIAEIKKGSPSEGIINKNFNLKKITKIYEKNRNVKAISVLTDREFFFMDMVYLDVIRKLTKKPLLRKDFIIDEYQIYESRFYGADVILLIARILSTEKINKFIRIAKKYNMDCLVEVHTEKELRKVLRTKAEIVGINNRNLDTLKVDLNTTLKLVKLIPKNKIIVSESGFKSREDIEKIKDKVNAVLIGTAFMRAGDIKEKIKNLIQ